MSFTEFHQAMSKSKSEPNQSKMASCPPDLSSFMPDDELVELLWENRQIVMQGQSQRPNKKSPFSTAIPSHSARAQDKDGGIPKIRRFVAMDAITDNELSPAVPNAHIGMNAQDDDMVPWMNYPMEDPLQNDYCSEFFSEFPGLNLNSLSSHNNSVAADQSGGFSLARDSRSVDQGQSMKPITGGSEVNRVKTSQLFQSPQQCQSSISNGSRLRASEMGASSDSIAPQVPSGDMLSSRFLKQDFSTSKPLQPSSSMGLMNFSHFTRPVALAKANLQSVDRLRSIEKAFTATSSNPVESALVDSASGLKNVSGMQGKSSDVPPKLDLRSSVKPSQKVASVAQSEAVCQEGASMSGNAHIADNQCRPPGHINHQSSSFTAVARHEAAKGPEAIVASSVCSGNKDGAASSDPKKRAKRKSHEGEESGYQSEDVDDESVGIKKAASGRGTVTKRSRAAEVHNLSERRRRDRINEKMRALQELIPNCNRVDKASMLDEAIEYLKTLQLQVQIMSMGSGLCMPSMLLPAGMQPIRTPPMAHFSPVGMGMGMGYGMGVLNMNGSPGCPLIPVPSLHGSQFPYPSIPGAQGLHGVPGSTGLQIFGIPGQGLPLSIPRPTPPFGSFAGPAKLNLVPEASGTATSSDAAPASSSQEQQQQYLNSEIPQGTSADDSKISASA